MCFRKKAHEGAKPSAVTLERIAQALHALGGEFDEIDNGFLTTVQGFNTIMTLEGDGAVLRVMTGASGYFGRPEQLPDAMAWANTWNLTRLFARALPEVDEDGDLVLNMESVFLATSGLTDEQISEFIQIGMVCNVEAIQQYIEVIEPKYYQ